MLDAWVVNTSAAIVCLIFFSQTRCFWIHSISLLMAVSPSSSLYPRLLASHWLVFKWPYIIHSTQFRERFSLWNKLEKTNYFYEKQFALLGFTCISSTITVDYMSLKMSFLPCNPLSLPLSDFSPGVIILCLHSKPAAMEINVMLQICCYL